MIGTRPPAASAIGPESWKNTSLRGIKLSQTIGQKSDKNCDIGRALDPLPHLRDVFATLSNDEIRRYTRAVRVVASRMRDSLLATNDEIKSLTRGKEALEKALEFVRKDIKLNKDSMDVRTTRPSREKENDGADDMLQAERQHLFNIKRTLEMQLKSVQQQLQVLDQARRRLFAALQERNRVLDFLCQANSSIVPKNPDGSYKDRSSLDAFFLNNQPDPLGPFTPEVDQALQDAQQARTRSAYLRKELKDTIDRATRLTRAAHDAVNSGITGKVAETITLKQHLGVAMGENRHTLHRSQRWYDASDKARGYTLGPVMSADIMTREKLDRPLVRLFQRHPGNQLPETQEVIKAGDGLLQSMTATSRNIGLLRLAGSKLDDDYRSKSAAADIDSSIIRMRRRKAPHRWCLGEAF